MSGSPQGDRPSAARSPRAKWREHAPLKLLRSLRGEGALIWSGAARPATYELDIFSSGATRSASGQIQGDFAPILAALESHDGPMVVARLKLADGQEIEVTLSSLEETTAEFDTTGAAGLGEKLSALLAA